MDDRGRSIRSSTAAPICSALRRGSPRKIDGYEHAIADDNEGRNVALGLRLGMMMAAR
jgi:hypothetical protein